MTVVLGGGIGGLSAAYYLLRKFPKEAISVYEATNRVGGWIKSNKLPNGVIFEEGPRTIRPKGEPGQNTLNLIRELDLSNEIVPITTSSPAAKNRMIYANGKLNILPNKFIDILRTFSPFKKPLLLHIMQDLTAKRKVAVDNDESIYDFVERRFGKDIADYAISPMICGICAGNAKEISVKFLMESLFEKEQKYGSITKGVLYDFVKKQDKKKSELENTELSEMARKWSIYSFKDGLEILPITLEKHLTNLGAKVRFNRACKQIEFSNNEVYLNVSGYQKTADHLVSTLSAPILAKLVENQHPILADHLKSIPHVTVVVVNLHYNKKLNIKDAFGFLVPPSENIPILGVIFDSCCFPANPDTTLTVMMGGHWFEKYFGKSPKEDQLLSTALQQVKNILEISSEPDNFKVNILRNCIPQYVVGHQDRVRKIEGYIRDKKLPLSICGASYYGVGVNDVIMGAKNAILKIKN